MLYTFVLLEEQKATSIIIPIEAERITQSVSSDSSRVHFGAILDGESVHLYNIQPCHAIWERYAIGVLLRVKALIS